MNTTHTTRDARRSTPWGTSDTAYEYAPGIVFYTTPSHGGFLLGSKRNAEIPAALRVESGAYEEDCDYARVIVSFPSVFTPEDVEAAKRTLRQWYPDAYEAWTGETIAPGQSMVKDERAWYAANMGRLAAFSVLQHDHSGAKGTIPEGMYGVWCRRIAFDANGKPTAYHNGPEDRRLIPVDAYKTEKGAVLVLVPEDAPKWNGGW